MWLCCEQGRVRIGAACRPGVGQPLSITFPHVCQNWFTNLRKRHWDPLRKGREPRSHFDVALLAAMAKHGLVDGVGIASSIDALHSVQASAQNAVELHAGSGRGQAAHTSGRYSSGRRTRRRLNSAPPGVNWSFPDATETGFLADCVAAAEAAACAASSACL